MKATGIVRRIDDLGRVVIPKEIRRTMRLREGDPMEIFLENDMVCFKKYSIINSISNDVGIYANSLRQQTGLHFFVCDTDRVLVNKTGVRTDTLNTRLLDEIINSGVDVGTYLPSGDCVFTYVKVIKSAGDVRGALVFTDDYKLVESHFAEIDLICNIISRVDEE